MTLIIDGHNLIGVLPGINLGDPNDELSLLVKLRAFRAAQGGRSMIVFFDSGDMPGNQVDLSRPGLQVQFAQPGETADDAILDYLHTRAQPGQYAVVTNDQGLAFRARMAGASTVSATTFAERMAPPKREARPAGAQQAAVQGPDPHDPAYADIYAAFLEAEKNKGRFPAGSPQDVATWTERLYGEDVEEAQRAARWLGLRGGGAALGLLRDALTHGDARVRAAALLALGERGDPAAIPDLASRLREDTASMAREAAAQALGRLGGKQAEEALEEAAELDSKRKVRKAAREALGQVRARKGRA